MAYKSYQEENKDSSRVAALQDAAKDLGFELPDECFKSDWSDLEGWLDAQSQLYNSIVVKKGQKGLRCESQM